MCYAIAYDGKHVRDVKVMAVAAGDSGVVLETRLCILCKHMSYTIMLYHIVVDYIIFQIYC